MYRGYHHPPSLVPTSSTKSKRCLIRGLLTMLYYLMLCCSEHNSGASHAPQELRVHAALACKGHAPRPRHLQEACSSAGKARQRSSLTTWQPPWDDSPFDWLEDKGHPSVRQLNVAAAEQRTNRLLPALPSHASSPYGSSTSCSACILSSLPVTSRVMVAGETSSTEPWKICSGSGRRKQRQINKHTDDGSTHVPAWDIGRPSCLGAELPAATTQWTQIKLHLRQACNL